MTIIEGIVVIVFIIGVFVFLGLNVVRSDSGVDAPRSSPRTPPMWTTVTTYGPMCPSVKVSDGSLVKLCIREANHDGECQYKIIDLGGSDRYDEVL